MEIVKTKDKEQLFSYFSQDKCLFAYHIGDLDEFFFHNCTFYGLQDNGFFTSVVLLYEGGEIPTLQALGMSETLITLVKAISGELPDQFYCHYLRGYEQAFHPIFQLNSLGTHYKMEWVDRSLVKEVDTSGVEVLTPGEHEQALQFYKISYPDHYFHPRMLETGKYFKVESAGNILAIAGLHVYSEHYDTAVLGNIATIPEARRQGLSTKVTAQLLKELSKVGFVGLNVKVTNEPAVAMYEALGFKFCYEYEEALVERRNKGQR